MKSILSPAKVQKVMVVLGTRPEGTKISPVIQALRNDSRFHPVVVNTGQHKELLAPVLDWFDVTADHTMDVMSPGQPLASLTSKLLTGLHGIMEQEKPDIVTAVGDTTSVMVAALASYYAYDYYVRNEDEARRHIRFAHIEAGLRTGNMYAPFPEEANRKLVATLAHWHFAPTPAAAESLFNEAITENVFITGNTAIDALHYTTGRLKQQPRPLPGGLQPGQPCILITGHRRENYGEGFEHICEAIKTLALRYPAFTFVYPVHLNQHVQGPVKEMLANISNVCLCDPLPYPDLVNLMQHCHLILTDSGGLQEEGPALGKPVLVMRELTERPEGITAGTARLVGTGKDSIIRNVADLLDNPATYNRMANAVNPYGDGFATQRILNLLAGGAAEDNTFTPLYKAA
jgi:UDP-N-acetylglucosamine 2-epimerase (non-hydrolysing)